MSKIIADVSKHNETINFEKMKKVGVAAVIIRAGYRTAKKGIIETDPRYTENIQKAEKAGLPLGVYWWTSALSVKEAEAEANACINLLQGHKLSFPIFLDLEYYSERKGRADHLSAAARTTYALAFLERCRKLGYEAGVYCNPDYWKDALVADRLKHYPRWIAHYGGKSAGMPCDIWQYTSMADGPKYGSTWKFIDLSVMYTDFPAGEKSKFAKDKNAPTKSATGNPYPEPALTVTSDAQAKAKGIKSYVSTGDGVRWFQYELKRLGYDIGASGIDGDCGEKTAAAIGAVQADTGLTVDKLGGAKTRAALKALEKKPEQSEKKETGGFRSRVAAAAKKVYETVVKVGCRHKSGATTLAEIIAKRITTCSSSVTATLKEAGLMKKGKLGHRKKDGHGGKTKTTPEKVFYGLEYLDMSKVAEIVMVNKAFKDLPEKYRKPGIVYGQDSNICISAGDGYIYSTNEGSIQYKKGHYVRTKVKSGYPATAKVLAVIVPKD